MRESFLVFGQPLIEQDEIDEVVDSMHKAWIGTGPKVHQFERDFAAYKGVAHAAAVNSCTAALHLACLTLDLAPGDEVITTAMTFCASVNAIIHAGGTPVLADADPVTLNISAETIAPHIGPRTRAIMVVHYAGRCCDMDPIMELARKHGLIVIEDCAHAIESEYKGRKAGTIGHIGCFSFYATKNIVTGEGGMIISDDKAAIDRCKIMALHGMSADAWARFSDAGYKHYQVVDHGFKYNMMDIQAAMGIHQLRRVEEYWKRRACIWQKYNEGLAGLGMGLPADAEEHTRHAYHLYTIRVSAACCGVERDAMLEALRAHNIGVGVHYLAVPEHPYYRRRFGWDPADTPVATAYGRETVSLPLSPKLSDGDVDDVIEAIRAICTESAR
ncbi:Glutamine--scyllo-inositol transaminase [Oleidesulfovibrio alaskensis G20]|uniref:Glutamine--scyllo-inositol transaminase n=1 Tax=Oleidesulfovibrio alaskensis (strain ATCC BAA-1058 / DSM 17464 / G20) TaxID=207559 RepID=Q313G4_OLEA2|nr:DegT/DnrJ/EryC1/StrS family aminotransferase [Oleidesulfovibrio alaskensis]ABB37932.1 Glutamine--scyllo-inositol transaminase [Oleidesulfovibrio alaskensis G20]MBG0772916.1 DegT/DnrJ/EryC1/StrS family aminotransferase [Oleidesulfovibrio alaskensis]